MDFFTLNANTTVQVPEQLNTPIQYALDMFVRDMENVFESKPLVNAENETGDVILLSYDEGSLGNKLESFSIRFTKHDERTVMTIKGSDDLGMVYGLLHISKTYLGIDPFWYWADLKAEKKDSVYIPIEDFDSPRPAVRYRGWFVNDEVCLIGWKREYPPTKEVWYPVFEALLRSGGNMVIPGTDLPKEGIHWDLASEMGLWITHHHAEPLGAEMFKRAYPDKQASYASHGDLYEDLWEEAIQKQKDKKVIWVLSFRGQGDEPFWKQDPSYDTPHKRGRLISNVIKKQFEMIKTYVDNPVCCVALYGEISELYKSGNIEVPEGVIKVWADNGYGKMVSRRNGNEDFRINSLPEGKEKGEQGTYYHVTFHDLQASNHLTMFPASPSLLVDELEKVLEAGGDDYLLLNSGNIRMHLYPLDIVSEMWNKGRVDVGEHIEQFVARLYASHHTEIVDVYNQYFHCTIQYGKHADNRAGEQFYHHPARRMISHWIQGKHSENLDKLNWATGRIPFRQQMQWFKSKCENSLELWMALREKCTQLLEKLSEDDKQRLEDQLFIQIELHYSGCAGLIKLCQSYEYARQEKYPEAFVLASQAIWDYQKGFEALRKSEHGKWKDFYRADWLTNVEWTLESLETLRRYLRMHGDSPHFFAWYKEYVMPETEKYIYLENTHREPLTNDELARKLEDRLSL
ncbi:glycosyl hydrolase 115 family protein [Halalkalibacter urbisdiaboli]|uniref:glycosyl hydrolase 115 family protein n=1 Tax=Halalkalibacter urbisdiaboli TaxID=1960589 RepID=UPI001FDA9C4F|nr:glycosyl hydrolase 115 family protein [Halalkalibacter urbisdiaboli]